MLFAGILRTKVSMAGILTLIVNPLPGIFSISIAPPCVWTIRWARKNSSGELPSSGNAGQEEPMSAATSWMVKLA